MSFSFSKTMATAGNIIPATHINMLVNAINSKSADFTISDGGASGDVGGYEVYMVDSGAGGVRATLPTAADNANRIIEFMKTNSDDSAVTIDGEGAETINGQATIFLIYQYQKIRLMCNGTGWVIIGGNIFIDSGWINRSDWTNVHMGGAEVDIDGGSNPLTFKLGEIVTESVSGNTGIITKITDSGGGAGTLYLAMVTGTGIFTDGRTLTGSQSSDVATVNEGTGSTKNLDTYFYHGLGLSLTKIQKRFLISSDKTEANTWEVGHGVDDNTITRFGYMYWGVDTNSTKLQSGAGGVRIFADDGTSTAIDTEDYYYKIIFSLIF